MIRQPIVIVMVALGLAVTANTSRADINLDFVTVGNVGNAADDTGYGAVDYAYQIGQYEVTAGQYTTFLNAVAATDPYGLYNPEMSSHDYGCKIQQNGTSGNYTYSVAPDRANRPVNFVSWGDAARFINWMHNGQGNGSTENGAYDLNGATSTASLMIVMRNANATYWLPSEDEWYKAAYHKNDGVTGNYFDYPNGSDILPSNDLVSPDPGNNANFLLGTDDYTIGGPYYMTEVGEFENSVSPYGTFDQGGNVWEWTEAAPTDSARGLRGSSWIKGPEWLAASARGYNDPAGEYRGAGFRVARVPEPGSFTLMLCGVLAGCLWRYRKRKN